MTAVASKKPETALFELINRGSSGFFKEGTQGTPEASELTTTDHTWLPTEGYMSFVDEKGDRYIKEIRYISGQDIILKEEQEKKGLKANPRQDKIAFIKGFIRIANSGSERGLFAYLKNVFYNEQSPEREEKATAVFREVDQNKVPELLMEDDDALVRALQITTALKTKTANGYEYNEERIESLCRLFKIQAEAVGQQLALLSNLAKLTPAAFVTKVENFEQKYETEINQALELKVITLTKTGAIFESTGDVITDFGTGNFSKEKRMNMLVDFFRSPAGEKSIETMRVLVDTKVNEQFK